MKDVLVVLSMTDAVSSFLHAKWPLKQGGAGEAGPGSYWSWDRTMSDESTGSSTHNNNNTTTVQGPFTYSVRFCRTHVLFGLLVPLFWISGDVSSGFQSQSGFCLIRFF